MSKSVTKNKAPKSAWWILALLMLASVVSFVDRQVVAIVVEPMKADLGVRRYGNRLALWGFCRLLCVGGLADCVGRGSPFSEIHHRQRHFLLVSDDHRLRAVSSVLADIVRSRRSWRGGGLSWTGHGVDGW